jgi:hypothetical protein
VVTSAISLVDVQVVGVEDKVIAEAMAAVELSFWRRGMMDDMETIAGEETSRDTLIGS